MRAVNVPALGPRYWVAISLASIFGANTGDFVSRVLGLGHARGLAPLAVLLVATLLIERRSRIATEAYYWIAIVIVRTAATNLADLGTHDLRLGYPGVIAVLAVLLALIQLVPRGADAGAPTGLPATDARYWAAMLIAGTLGTAVGDAAAGALGLGLASIVSVAVLAVALALRSRDAVATAAGYWITIAIVRTAGTNVGDFLDGRHGLDLGLPVSTTLTGLLFVGTLLIWRPHVARRALPEAAPAWRSSPPT